MLRPGGDLEVKSPGWCHSHGHELVAPQNFSGDWWSSFSSEEQQEIREHAAMIVSGGGLRTHEQTQKPWVRGYKAAELDQAGVDVDQLYHKALDYMDSDERSEEAKAAVRLCIHLDPTKPHYYEEYANILWRQRLDLASAKQAMLARAGSVLPFAVVRPWVLASWWHQPRPACLLLLARAVEAARWTALRAEARLSFSVPSSRVPRCLDRG